MKKIPALISFILIIFAIWYTYYSSIPRIVSDLETPITQFSTLKALKHVKEISRTQHYVGSPTHDQARDYVFGELKKLGLVPQIQEGFSISKTGTCARVQNIVAKIKGREKGKALLLLSHYDSATHSSYGASDAGSGVATILEGLRAYLQNNKASQNDIIICITDGEELGLNGADYFVKNHLWAENIGVVLNFEARGSGGPSYMLVETNGKNSTLIDHFYKAKTPFPIANSLAYSIYKMLPNDTDLTVFREQLDIDGFNFAFIDDHFDYHTANDTWQRLDLSTLQHQGSYLMALLPYFSEIDLSDLKSGKDDIYFNFPLLNMIKYPFSWIFKLLIIAVILYILLIFYGTFQSKVYFREVLKGFGALLLSLILAGGMSFGLWELLVLIYPEYSEIQHGFPYNGYTYIAAFVLLSISICFRIYAKIHHKENQPSLMIASLGLWLLISAVVAVYLPGASYFILLVFLGFISLLVIIRQKVPNVFLLVLLSFPAIYIICPFISSFPVALGLRILFISAILTVLLFALLIPVFGFYKRKKMIGNIALFLCFALLIAAHFRSDFSETRLKPNSLLYILDTDKNIAVWATYDHLLDSWNKNYIHSDENIAEQYNANTLQNKYGKQFEYVNEAPLKNIPSPIIEIKEDSIIGLYRQVHLCIAAQRSINRVDLYTKTLFNFEVLSVNGKKAMDFTYKDGNIYNAFTKRWSKNLLTHYVTNNESLEILMKFPKDSIPQLTIYESSYDLLENHLFSIPARSKTMMPKPFLLNDAVVVKKSIILNPQSTIIDTLSVIKQDSIYLN